MNGSSLHLAEDRLYPSDNIYDIPCLRIDRQGKALLLPLAPYGAGRTTKTAQTVHFYVDDYRFANLWKLPAKLLNSNVRAIVEPNFSLFDTTPMAQGLDLIYRKRWLARFYQECGLDIYVDLNVSSKFHEVNALGIPRTWNAFATRGTHGHIEELMAEVEIARRISGVDIPNLIVYGGGKEIQKYCNENSLLYIHDFMSSKR